MATSSTTATRHGWRLPPLGANRASSRTANTVARLTGSALKARVAPVVRSVVRTSIARRP
jgi:hypothetical protein